MTEEKIIRVKRKEKCGTHSYQGKDNELITIKGGESWDCPVDYAQKLDPNQWVFLDPVEEAAIGGPSRRNPPAPKVGLVLEKCSDQEGMFDVVNEKTGKRINDDPLTEEEANTLIKEHK